MISLKKGNQQIRIIIEPQGIIQIDLIMPNPGSMPQQDEIFDFYKHLLNGVDELEKGTKLFRLKRAQRALEDLRKNEC